ncbi:MAG: hypothetical protein R2939_07510 [Kofleriaceae bacterium]
MDPAQVTLRLRALREPDVRVAALIEAWSTGDVAVWIAYLARLLERAHATDDLDALAALETVARAAGSQRLAYGARQRLYEAAAHHPHRPLARLFFAASPPTATDAQLDKQLAAERPLQPRERPMTLGERKALARTHRRGILIALCKDPHPEVVSVLLDNPHVTEPDVVRIAALRPAVPAALARIAEHGRWPLRQGVKRALVWNPATPLDVGIRIATTLRAAELREIAAAPSLPAVLRGHVAELLAVTRPAPDAWPLDN